MLGLQVGVPLWISFVCVREFQVAKGALKLAIQPAEDGLELLTYCPHLGLCVTSHILLT